MSRWPVEETGMNSVIPSTIPSRMTVIQSGIVWINGKMKRKTRKKSGPLKRDVPYALRFTIHASRPGSLVFLFATQQRGKSAFGIFRVLPDFQLAEDGMPADVDFVPLAFNVSQRAFVHLAEEAERGGVADEGVDFLLGRRVDLDAREDKFQFLHEEA